MLNDSVFLLGIGLGLRHATDADHVVAVSAMLRREPGLFRAMRLALYWGIGHSTTFLGTGLVVVLTGWHVPAAYERFVELLVGVTLVILGLTGLLVHTHVHRSPSVARPVSIGLLHGLAGSAGVALLALTTIRSAAHAMLYLVVFAGGTLVGMAILTAAFAWLLGRVESRPRSLRALTQLPCAFSMGMGVFFAAEAVDGLFQGGAR